MLRAPQTTRELSAAVGTASKPTMRLPATAALPGVTSCWAERFPEPSTWKVGVSPCVSSPLKNTSPLAPEIVA